MLSSATARATRRPSLVAIGAAAFALAFTAMPRDASAVTTTLSFDAVEDVHVSSSAPQTNQATRPLYVDASAVKESYLRFDLSGIEGREVVDVKLRMYQRDSSVEGGVVSLIEAPWGEASTTYQTRPSVSGTPLGAFGPVAANQYYNADLEESAVADGELDVALTSPSSDSSVWAQREAGAVTAPKLLVEVEVGSTIIDGLSKIADATVGSSEPTYFNSQHRVEVTDAGRMLAVHGLHATGPRLVWRDPAGSWASRSEGSVQNGILTPKSGTGDWPASIALARDSAGEQHAWIVFAPTKPGMQKNLSLRRISNLDGPNGPTIGPLVTLDGPGSIRPDIAFETLPSGAQRGTVLWTRKVSDTRFELTTGSLTDLDTDTPEVHSRVVLNGGGSSQQYGTVVSARDGMRILTRPGNSRLVPFTRPVDAPATAWNRGANGISITGDPAATALSTGEVLTVIEDQIANDSVNVLRYSPAGVAKPVELDLEGYSTPTITSDGTEAWIVMIRESDDYVVSRHYTPQTGWSGSDRVEIGPEGNGPYRYPNADTTADGRLRIVVEGPGSVDRSEVYAFQRPLYAAP